MVDIIVCDDGGDNDGDDDDDDGGDDGGDDGDDDGGHDGGDDLTLQTFRSVTSTFLAARSRWITCGFTI